MKAQATAAIKVKGLSRSFGEKKAVNGIDLSIARGEIYGFLGPNGAGKSTTIRMLVTLLGPTKGDAWIMGHSIRTDVTAVRLAIGVALQDVALDGSQTGRELLELQGRLYGLTRDEIKARVTHLEGLVALGAAFDQRIDTYSGGMKRRLDLAAALVHNPSVLFLDEPTTGLDPVSRRAVWDEIRHLNKNLGITVFLTTQYLEEADQLADRVGIIAGGKLVAEGTPTELKRKIGADVVVLHTAGDAQAAAKLLRKIPKIGKVEVHGKEITITSNSGAKIVGPVALELSKAGMQIEQLSLRTLTLDDVFLAVTGGRMKEDEQ